MRRKIAKADQAAREGALAGVRVLEVGSAIAGPLVGSLLSDFGAEVIKIEEPGKGDTTRHGGPFHEGVCLYWLIAGRNKQCITLNFRKPRGQEIFKQLVAVSDIVVENSKPGMLEKYHLGYDDLKKVNRGIVMVRVSGFGQSGPYAHRPAYDRIGQAMGGLIYVTGFPPPAPMVKAGLAVADYGTSVFAAFGAMLALHYRDTTGKGEGQVVDCALYESILSMQGSRIDLYEKQGIINERVGNDAPWSVPGDLVVTSDGKHVLISAVSDEMFGKLAAAMGEEHLASEPLFDTLQKRALHREFLNETVGRWAAQRTLAEVSEILDEYGVPFGPAYSVKEIAEDVHFKERESVIEVPDRRVGKVKMPGVTPKLTLTPGKVRHTGRDLGEDTDFVLNNLLHVNDETLAELRADGVI